MKMWWIILIAVISLSIFARSCSITYQNKDISGNDLTSKQGQFFDCCNYCSSTPGCKAYVWNNDQGGTCWLKSAEGPLIANNGVSVGILNQSSQYYTQDNMDTVGNAITSMLGLELSVRTISSDYSLKKSYEGNNFFDGFDFFTYDDPTHGFVDYVDRKTAVETGLISITNGKIKISSDSIHKIQSDKRGRPSVRLESKDSYNEGLFLFDLDHMPTGPGTWPAYWFCGDDWPNNGEADILEGIDGMRENNFALHTSDGCRMSEQDQSLFTGKWSLGKNGHAATNCYKDPNQYENQGCSIHTPNGFFGDEFNRDQGGLFAFEWERNSYMRIWIFKRNQIPLDILQGKPNPLEWGKPMAYFKLGSNCSPNHFNAMKIIINLTFCGDWAGNAYLGGMDACIDAVRTRPWAYSNGYWIVNYVKVFEHKNAK